MLSIRTENLLKRIEEELNTITFQELKDMNGMTKNSLREIILVSDRKDLMRSYLLNIE
ncbi:hypothetical protein ACSW9O_15235 (plasmid) [Clostridium perfringens]